VHCHNSTTEPSDLNIAHRTSLSFKNDPLHKPLQITKANGWCQNSYSSSPESLEKASRTSRLATMKNDLSYHNLSAEDATELALDRPLWRLLAASGATHWIEASWTMTMMTNGFWSMMECYVSNISASKIHFIWIYMFSFVNTCIHSMPKAIDNYTIQPHISENNVQMDAKPNVLCTFSQGIITACNKQLTQRTK